MGWIKSSRGKNQGAVGNTLEDLLGIDENNLPIANAAEWELKAQREKTSSLTTGFHLEPSPKAFKFVPKVLLPNYGWPHQKAGLSYPADELSFRQTINAVSRTDRGFGVVINNQQRRIEVSFDYQKVSPRHKDWLETVDKKVGLGELSPQPYWGFDDVFFTLGAKLQNYFYVKAKCKIVDGIEYFWYDKIFMLSQVSQAKFLEALSSGNMLVDFDARTRHNHGTKFRSKKDILTELYATKVII